MGALGNGKASKGSAQMSVCSGVARWQSRCKKVCERQEEEGEQMLCSTKPGEQAKQQKTPQEDESAAAPAAARPFLWLRPLRMQRHPLTLSARPSSTAATTRAHAPVPQARVGPAGEGRHGTARHAHRECSGVKNDRLSVDDAPKGNTLTGSVPL